ncbi:hypothetical protein PSEUDO8AS_40349 [Pseudomonas sp. 8AS]|nr:hypothetical protein PSEUDO8AS_40349 [Pseudomonas sp. 8AS]
MAKGRPIALLLDVPSERSERLEGCNGLSLHHVSSIRPRCLFAGRASMKRIAIDLAKSVYQVAESVSGAGRMGNTRG